MRVTVHLDTFKCAEPVAYVVAWLDCEARKWSCEGHESIDIPGWGVLRLSRAGVRLFDVSGTHLVFDLPGLDLTSSTSVSEGESGTAFWYPRGHHVSVVSHWHVQCVDKAEVEPENGLFADDEP